MEKKKSIKFGLVMALIMALFLGLYSLLAGSLALTEGWAGYMFFWCWSSIREFDFKSIKKDIPCSLVGIALSYLMFYVHSFGNIIIFDVVIMITLIIVLFFSVTKLLPYVVNEATFLFFTVLTGNTMLSQAKYGDIVVSYVLGIVFFLLTLGTTLKLLTRKSKK